MLGATVGMVIAAAMVLAVALRWTGTGRAFTGSPPAGVPKAGAYVALILPIMVGQLFTNGLMQADILLLGRYLSVAAAAAGHELSATTTAKTADEWVGVYRACQLFAFLPYQMLFSVTQVLFPMLARAKAEEGDERVAELVSRGCRIGAVVCGMFVVVVVAIPGSLLQFAYGREIALRGASTLHVLALGQAAFAMLGLSTTVLVSLSRERTAMALSAVALTFLGLMCTVIIPRAACGVGQLHATATATTAALFVALVVGIIAVRKVARAFVPVKTAIRVGLVVLAAYAAGGVLPIFPRAITPLVAAAVALVYVLLLTLSGELGKADFALIVSVASRRAKR
jgi:stage V sporulation protein B